MLLEEQFDADDILRDQDEELPDEDELETDLREVDFESNHANQENYRDLSSDIDADVWE